MGGVNGHRGLWGFVRGGMGAVSNAIADSARSRGATIRTNAPVEKILVARARVSGVVLQVARKFARSMVASNLDPAPHVPSTDGRGRSARRLPRRHPQVPLRGNVAEDEPGAQRCFPSSRRCRAVPDPSIARRCTSAPRVEYIERAWDDAKYGRPSRSPLIEMTIPTMYDPSLAPAGRHIMGIFLQYAPYTLRGTNWDAGARALHRAHSGRDRGILPQYPVDRGRARRRCRRSIWSGASASPAATFFMAK